MPVSWPALWGDQKARAAKVPLQPGLRENLEKTINRNFPAFPAFGPVEGNKRPVDGLFMNL